MFFKQVIFICVVTSLLLQNVMLTEQKKCRVLALEGGGDKGAYQAGAIRGLVNSLPADDVKWDVVTGISIGSLNGLILALHEIGDEKLAADALYKEWRKITGGDYLYRNWPWGGIVRGLLFETGLYDTTPAFDNITAILKQFKGLKRQYVCGAVDAETGVYEVFDNSNLTNNDEIRGGVLSSGAYPVVFPLYFWNKKYFMDGGVNRGIDIGSGIHRCQDKGFKDEDIIVDIVLCGIKTMANVDPSTLRPLSTLARYLAIAAFDKSMSALEDTLFYFKNVQVRYLVAPTGKLPSNAIPLDFTPKEIEAMLNMGQKDAQSVVQGGPGKNFREYVDKYSIKKEKEREYLRTK